MMMLRRFILLCFILFLFIFIYNILFLFYFVLAFNDFKHNSDGEKKKKLEWKKKICSYMPA